MYRMVYWDIDEFFREFVLRYPHVVSLFGGYPEAINDLIALSLRDAAVGAHYYLDDFVNTNYGTGYEAICTLFRAHAVRWYGEILRFVGQHSALYDNFYIEEILQFSPRILLVKVFAEYRYCDPEWQESY